MLLILIAMQVIGVYFVRQLETTLKDNFKTSIQDKVNILAFYLEEQLTMDRLPQEDESTLKLDIQKLLDDYSSEDILEVRVIDGETKKILGTSDPDNQGIVGQKSTDTRILRIFATGQSDNEEMIDRETGKRIWVLASPVKKKDGEVIRNFPASLKELAKCEPIYEEFDSWKEDISSLRKFEDLPDNAKKYLKRIEELVGVKIGLIGVGKDREQTIRV